MTVPDPAELAETVRYLRAQRAVVLSSLWQRHLDAALSGLRRLGELERDLAEAREDLVQMRRYIEEHGRCPMGNRYCSGLGFS